MFSLRTRLLTLRPRVTHGQNELTVQTAWLVRAATLFSFNRHVHVDAGAQYLFWSEREFWLRTKKRTIPFRDVARITYSFGSTPTSWDFLGRVHDTVESFSVGVELKSSLEVIPLTRFTGAGAAGDIGTWLLGDDLVDFQGTQEDESRAFVTRLSQLLGVGLSAGRSA